MRQRLKQGLSYCDPNHNPEGKPPGTGAKTQPSTPARTPAQTTLTAVCSLTHAVSAVTPLYPLQGAWWGGGAGAGARIAWWGWQRQKHSILFSGLHAERGKQPPGCPGQMPSPQPGTATPGA